MTDKMNLILRIAGILILLASAVWSAIYFSQLPFNATIAAMSALHAALWLLLAWLLLRNHPGRPVHSSPAFIFAGFVSGMALCAPSVTTNESIIAFKDWLGLSSLEFTLLTPTAEELFKFATVFILSTMIFRIRRPIEAVTIAIAVGFGFAALENATYILKAALDNLNSDVEGSLMGYAARTVPGPWGHSLYLGLSAWGLGVFLCRTDKSLGWRIGQLVIWYFLGFAIHSIFNASTELPGEIAPLVTLIAVIAFTWIGGIWLYLRTRKIGRRDIAETTEGTEVASHGASAPTVEEVSAREARQRS